MTHSEIVDRQLRCDHHATVADKFRRRIANVLIIDDDVDWAIAVEATFRQFGCNVEFALDAQEAQRKVSAGKADIIILDWMLDHQTSADQVVQASIRRMDRFPPSRDRDRLHIPKIITFSSKDESEIYLPDSRYYKHMAHWHKPLRYPELTRKAVKLMNQMGY